MEAAGLRVVSPADLGEFVPAHTAVLASFGATISRHDGVKAWAMRRSFLDAEAGRPPGAHPVDCACCGAGRALDASLSAVFAATVRGQAIATVAVVVPEEDVARIRAVCAGSAVVAARFRIL